MRNYFYDIEEKKLNIIIMIITVMFADLDYLFVVITMLRYPFLVKQK